VIDEEDKDLLAQFVFLGVQVVVGMGYEAWLEDSRQVCRWHEIRGRVFCKDSEEVEDVEEELPVEFGQLTYQALIRSNCVRIVTIFVVYTKFRLYWRLGRGGGEYLTAAGMQNNSHEE